MKPEYSEDDVHPNKAGYTVMEPMVKEAIDKMYADQQAGRLPRFMSYSKIN